MAFRTLVISNHYDLYLKNNQLVLSGEDEYTLPVEDISSIVIEDNRVKITNRLLSAMAANNIVCYSCNEKHIPVGVFIPFNNHSRTYKVQKNQINATEPLKKRLWKNIITCKLRNQGEVLTLAKKKEADFLINLSNKVLSGDTDNKEAQGARIYFKALFGEFTRDDECWINSALNYGYTIIRGAIARSVASYGLIPAIGIHHKNELNNFNLADDLIEPFRPIVDLWTYNNSSEGKIELSKEDKHSLVDLLNYNMKVNNENHSVLNAIDITVQSLSTSFDKSDYNFIKLPSLTGLTKHFYE